jgi:hypothetical protein
MLRRLKRLVYIIRHEGHIAGIKWLTYAIYHRCIPEKQIIWCMDLTKLNTDGLLLPDNLKLERYHSMKQVDDHDLKTLIAFHSDLMGSATSILIPERFNKGAVLWLLKEDCQIAGYQWTIANNHATPTYFPHTEGDVHSIGIEIMPDYRGHNLQNIFQKQMWIILKNEGFKRFLSETYLRNERAIKAFSKTGQRGIGIASRFNFFGKNVVIWHDMSKNIELNN